MRRSGASGIDMYLACGCRHLEGLRDRQASSGAGIKKCLEIALQPTEWMDCAAIKTVRRACKRTPEENRLFVCNNRSHDKKPA